MTPINTVLRLIRLDLIEDPSRLGLICPRTILIGVKTIGLPICEDRKPISQCRQIN